MTVVLDDTKRGTTYGDPDGPLRYIDTLDCEVPTFIDPRLDLIPPVKGRDKAFKRVDYHVPFKFRGHFKVRQWPEAMQARYGPTVRTDTEGFVLCTGTTASGTLCKKMAMNRTLFCASHGGGLHPADKQMASISTSPIPADRVERMDRVQKFLTGLLDPWDLDDDEIQNGYVRNDDGFPVRGWKLGAKFQAILAKELHTRLNSFLQSNTSDMLKVMVNIAKNDMYEAADRIKAAQWVAEKTMGKAPDVLVTSTANAPYASILESLEGGSREDFRKSIESSRGGDAEIDAPYEIIDAELESDECEVASEEGSERSEDQVGGMEEESSEVLVHARDVQSTREEKLGRAKAIRKAKQRRYAARAVGATSLSAMPWLVEFVPVKTEDGELLGHKLKMYPPDRQTPAVLDRLRAIAVRAADAVNEGEHDGESHGESQQ